MTVNVREHLTKVVNDLIGNRRNLAGQVEAQELQLRNMNDQLMYFDTCIASLKVQLADQTDATALSIEAMLTHTDLIAPIEAPALPLTPAGAGETVAAPAASDGGEGTDGNGSPVPGNADPLA